MLDVLSQPIDIDRIKANFQRWFERRTSALARWLPQWLLEDKVVFEIEPIGATNFKISALVNGDQVASRDLQASELRSVWPTLFSRELSSTRSGRITYLVLPRDLSLVRKLHLPTMSTRSTEFAELQIDTETPFNREDVYFSALVEAHPSDEEQQIMELAVAPRQFVDPLLSTLAEAGISIESVTTAQTGNTGKRHNLLPRQQRSLVSTKNGIAIALAGLLALQFCLLLFLPLYWRAESAVSAEMRADALVSKANKINEAFSKAADDLSVARRVLNGKRVQLSLLSTLKALTAAIPDDSYLDRAKYERDQVEVTGFTPSTTALIDLISKQRGFSSPAYVSPVTRDQQSGLERFDLSFKLTTGGGR